ncbi:MAG: response regulator, partial [Deltaproteobacteria bacterium]|nr:response regulator [Deltaproteobacteria bacterium]
EIARKRLGYKEQDMGSFGYLDLVHPEFVEFVRDIHQKRLSNRPVPDQYESRFITKGGESINCEIRVKKITYKGQTAFLVNLYGLDQKGPNEMKVRHKLRMDAFTKFASVIDNESELYFNIMNQCPVDFQTVSLKRADECQNWLKKAETAKERINYIRENLRCLARPKNLPSEISSFDLKQTVLNAIERTRPKWKDVPESNGIKVNLKTYLRALSPLEGNSREIQDVFEYLIINAVEALPEGGDIYLTVEEAQGSVHAYIQDNGAGISEDIKDRIFDPFFSTKDGSRLGLGLSLAYAIVKRHNGEIDVMGLEGQGTTFIIKLPLLMEGSPVKTHSGKKAINNCHILTIADETVINNLFYQIFSNKGCRVSTVTTNAEAIKLVKKEKIDLIISDLKMSYLQASAFVKKIREIDSRLPIFLVNSKEKAKTASALKKLGADLVSGRPIEMTRILSHACKILEGRQD